MFFNNQGHKSFDSKFKESPRKSGNLRFTTFVT